MFAVILKKRTTDIALKKYCVSLMEDYGSFDYTLQVLRELKDQIMEEVEIVGGNPYIDLILEFVSNEVY